MDAPQIPITPQILQLLTCFMVGLTLQAFLAGWVMSQGAAYFQTYGKTDKPLFKALVGYCLVLVLVYTGCYMAYTVRLYATNFGTALYALTPNKLVITTVFLNPFIEGAVSAFYAFRAYRVLQNSKIVAVLAALLVAFQFASGLFFAVAEATAVNFHTDHNVKLSGPMNLLALAATDTVLTSMLVGGLIKARREGISQGTGKLIQRLVMLAVEVNLLPTAFQILALILWYATDFAWLAITPTLPMIYVATLLFWLRARQATRIAVQHTSQDTVPVLSARRLSGAAYNQQVSNIRIQTLREVHVDEDKSMDDLSEKHQTASINSGRAAPEWLV